MGKLTDQRKLWAQHYITHWDATRAAIEAGYAETSARSIGGQLAHDASVGQYIAYLIEDRNKRLKIDADYVLRRLREIDELDIADLLDDNGRVLPVKEWPKAWRTSISGLDFGKLLQVGDDPERLIQTVDKIKWPDKIKNLELLGKHIAVKAWDKDAHQQTGEAPPLHITFDVVPAKADVRVTNAKP